MGETTTHPALTALDEATIAAIATPPGRGAIGIARLSGSKSLPIALKVTGRKTLSPRHAHLCRFFTSSKTSSGGGRELLDIGVAIFFPGPHSFTGEDIVELHGHGSPAAMQALVEEAVALGAREALPGEFSLRAFLNGKLDLAQAEAIADLIDSSSRAAARGAVNSLEGAFSSEVDELTRQTSALRAEIEADIDFSDQDIPNVPDSEIARALEQIIAQCRSLAERARSGARLNDNFAAVLCGRTNTGKSSLLNRLSRRDSAIVSSIHGTTRDPVREPLQLGALTLQVTDTAGARDTAETIEAIGIEKTRREVERADCLLCVIDATSHRLPLDSKARKELREFAGEDFGRVIVVRNKSDLTGEPTRRERCGNLSVVTLSAKTGQGLDSLREALHEFVGANETAQPYTTRQRHLRCLQQAVDILTTGARNFASNRARELLAEDLKAARAKLGEITGQEANDDLLGQIFTNFCIGK